MGLSTGTTVSRRVNNMAAGSSIGEHQRNDRTRPIDAQVQLLQAALALPVVLGGSPLAFSNDREFSAVDDQLDRPARRHVATRDVDALDAP